MSAPLRIAVVAGSALVRAGLADAIGERDDVRLGGAAASWSGLARLDVQVALVDVASTPERIPDDPLPAAVALLGDCADPRRWLRRGIGALPARAGADALIAAAQAAAAGLVAAPADWLSARGSSAMLQALTPREHEVLIHLAQGLGNRQIGERLAISEHTAKFHVAQIIAKLQAGSRAHAVAKALRAGLVDG